MKPRVYVATATLDVQDPFDVQEHRWPEREPDGVLSLELRGDYATLAAMLHHIRDMYEGRAPVPTAVDTEALPAYDEEALAALPPYNALTQRGKEE